MFWGNVGLVLGVYGPVSGNWCWIQPKFLSLRYALAYCWRITIFVATIVIYTVIYIRLRRIFSRLWSNNSLISPTGELTSNQGNIVPVSDSPRSVVLVERTVSVSRELRDMTYQSATANDDTATRVGHGHSQVQSHVPAQPNLKRMLLLNGYPIAYIILWIPGIVNRIIESDGTSPQWLRALQSTTQFIGFFNALTYGANEQLRRHVSRRHLNNE